MQSTKLFYWVYLENTKPTIQLLLTSSTAIASQKGPHSGSLFFSLAPTLFICSLHGARITLLKHNSEHFLLPIITLQWLFIPFSAKDKVLKMTFHFLPKLAGYVPPWTYLLVLLCRHSLLQSFWLAVLGTSQAPSLPRPSYCGSLCIEYSAPRYGSLPQLLTSI